MLTNTKVNIIKSLNYYDIEILILLNDHRIASISKEKLFSIINPSNNHKTELQYKFPFDEHIQKLTQLENDNLVLLLYPNIIKIFTLNPIELINTLHIDSYSIALNVVTLSHNSFAVSSRDSLIRIWNEPYKETIEMKGHIDEVSYLLYIKNRELLISSGIDDDKTLRIWNCKTYQSESVIE